MYKLTALSGKLTVMSVCLVKFSILFYIRVVELSLVLGQLDSHKHLGQHWSHVNMYEDVFHIIHAVVNVLLMRIYSTINPTIIVN